MANTKGKIIIGATIIVITGITTAIIVSHFRKKKFLKLIYDKINDTTSSEGQQALLTEENQLLGSNAFDPNFWKKTQGNKPNPNLLMPTKNAREIAEKMYRGNEKDLISEFKKLKSKGQVSQVASAYANPPKSYGNLAQDTTDALTGWFDNEESFNQLITFINSLPN